MLNIGILTIHNVINYGAVLQAYALLDTVRKKYKDEEYKVEIIDYNPNYFTGVKGCFNLINIKDIKSFLIELESLLLYKQYNRIIRTFRNFIEGDNNLSKKIVDINEIENYDILISGSDQVWNPAVTGGILDDVFYLNIPQCKDSKRIAYASSFGGTTFEGNQLCKVIDNLNGYDYLSCREKDGKDYIEKITDKKCEHVLDPSLLLTKKEWVAKIDKVSSKIQKLSEEKYILIYRLANSQMIYRTAKKVAEEKGLKVYEIGRKLRKDKYVDKVLKSVSPEEFLYLFNNAEFVITNSFHGTAFSLNFNKNFYSILPPSRTSRITSLLSLVGLEERVITNTIPNISEIDYNNINDKLTALRNASKSYLFESIDKCLNDLGDKNE